MASTPAPESPASPDKAKAASSPTGAASSPRPSAPAPATGAPGPSAPAPATVPVGAPVLEADVADDDHDGADSAFSVNGGLSDTTSVASSIYRYRVENGRTYHAYKAGAYFMPNDETENERLDLQHNLCIRMQDNQLYICPAGKDKNKPLGRVLDGGCGTGIWAIEFADEHPETAVVGVDLSPIQPNFVPPNVEFFIDDLEAEWTFVNPFDFIYLRCLNGSIRDWPKLINQAYEHLNPGGYLELLDPVNPMISDDGTLPDDSALNRWHLLLQEASEKIGAPLDGALQYKEHLEKAGFQDVVQVEYKWPTNNWPKDPKYKELGAWCHVNTSAALQALSLMLFTNVLGWTAAEVEVLLADVRKDLKNRSIHAYWPIYVVYGKKPE